MDKILNKIRVIFSKSSLLVSTLFVMTDYSTFYPRVIYVYVASIVTIFRFMYVPHKRITFVFFVRCLQHVLPRPHPSILSMVLVIKQTEKL